MMIQHTTFLRRSIGGLLVALVALFAIQVNAEPFLLNTAVDMEWEENSDQLSTLNGIVGAADTATVGTFCYTIKSTPSGVFVLADENSWKENTEPNDDQDNQDCTSSTTISLGTDKIVDFEAGKHEIELVGHRRRAVGTDTATAAGEKANSLKVTIKVTNVDEQALVKSEGLPASYEDTQYLTEGQSRSYVISQIFADPEGEFVKFSSDSDNDVVVCASGVPGTLTAPTDPTIEATSPYAINVSGDCALQDGDPNDSVDRGATGEIPNVVSTETVGPQLIIRADRLDTDKDNAGAGAYRADVYFRVWSGADDALLSSKLAHVTIHVKKGVNQKPQVTGGALGFNAKVDEGYFAATVAPDPAGGWNVLDFDETGRGGSADQNNDVITYSVVGTATCKDFPGLGKTYTLVSFSVCAKAEKDANGNLELKVGWRDFERAPAVTIKVAATDGWDTVEYDVNLSLNDVNEIEQNNKTNKYGAILPTSLRLINDQEVTLDLNDYFTDPEGDDISYQAYADIDNKSVVQDGDSITIKGVGATATETNSYVINIIASNTGDDAPDPKTAKITVMVRESNSPPAFDPGIRLVGMAANEHAKVGTYLAPLINFTDADLASADELTASLNSDMFTTVVNPKVKDGQACSKGDGCAVASNMIAIRVAKALNYEVADKHTLSLGLEDDWGAKSATNLEIQVLIADQNDPPIVKQMTVGTGDDEKMEDVEIPDQTIAVNGSGSMAVSDYFYDEDGDRLLITVSSDMKKVATASVSGLDMVSYEGLSEGEAMITLTADDNRGGSVSQSFKVVVTENTAPMADEDALAMRLPMDNTINVGSTAEIELEGLFSDPDGGDMVTDITASTSDEDILLVVSTDNGASVTLVGHNSGDATLTITATDKAGNMTSVDSVITVNAEPEEALPFDPQTFTRVTPLALDVSATFSDSDDGADSLMISAEVIGEGMDRVTFSDVVDGMLTITGVAGATPGDLEIKLTATDPHGATATSTFVATIENVAPTVAMAVEAQELDRTEPLDVDLNETFADADGSIASIVATVGEEGADFISVAEIDLEDGMLQVTALAVGDATVTLTATDDNGGMITSDFMVTVNNVAPTVANAVADQTTTRVSDPMLMVDVAETFSDPDTDEAMTFTVTSGDDSIASVMIDGSVISIEGLNVGTATITVTATDMDGGMVSNDFMVEVENITPTVAMSVDDQSFDRRAPLGVDLSGTFADEDGTISTITAEVSDGSVIEAMVDDMMMLTVNALAVGTSTVTLTATDANGAMVSSDFMVTIVNIVPVVANAVADQSTTRLEDLMIDVSETFDDPDQDNSALTITVATEDGTIVESMLDGTMLTIKGLSVGTTNVTLTAVDADGGMATNMFSTTIENVEPVVANAVADITDLDRRAPDMLDLSMTFSDADGTVDSIDVDVSDMSVIEAMLDDSMMLTINALSVGTSTVTLTATDANGAMISDDFNVTVVNIEPVVANSVPNQTTTRVQDVTLDVSGVFADPDQDDSMLSLEVMTADGSIVDAALSGNSLTIKGLAVGNTDLTLTATDMDAGMAMTSFNVTIDNVAPMVAGSLSPVTLEVGGQPASQSIAGLFSDDGDPLSYSIASSNSGIASASLTGMTAMVAPVSRGTASYTITASDPHGGSVSVTASIAVGDGELKAVASKSLAGFGRALLASVSSSVGSRVATDARASDLTLDAWAPTDDSSMSMTAGDRSEMAWNVVNTSTNVDTGSPSAGAGYGMSGSGMDMLRSTFGQSFGLNLGSSDNPSSWSIWGDVDRQSYEGEGYDGMASSVYIGADVTVAECWLFGVAVSSNSGESDYSWGTATQTMDLSLTTVLPYVSYQPTDRTSIWGVAGFGSGELDTTVQGASNDVSDLSSQILMVGGSQHLTNVGRFDLALKGDAASASLETEDGAGAADGLMADVSRIRAGLEGSFRTETGQGGMLEPFGQVSLRSDGGDGDTGTGIEIAGGVRMTSDTFSLEVRGRTLAMHSADEYSESGFSLMATLNPSASATGVSVTIAPRWGADAMGSGAIWQDTLSVNTMQSYGAMTGFGNFGAQQSVDAQIGYGMLVAQENYLLTPFVDFRVSDGDRREMLFGASLRQMVRSDADLDVNLALGRVEERTGDSSGKIGLNATLRF